MIISFQPFFLSQTEIHPTHNSLCEHDRFLHHHWIEARNVVGSDPHLTCCYPAYLYPYDRIILSQSQLNATSQKTTLPFGNESMHRIPDTWLNFRTCAWNFFLLHTKKGVCFIYYRGMSPYVNLSHQVGARLSLLFSIKESAIFRQKIQAAAHIQIQHPEIVFLGGNVLSHPMSPMQ